MLGGYNVSDIAMTRRFTALGTVAALGAQQVRNPSPGVDTNEYIRFLGGIPLGVGNNAIRLYSDQFKRSAVEAFNAAGARRATAEAQASASRRKSPSSGRRSLLTGLLGLAGEEFNSTSSKLGGGA